MPVTIRAAVLWRLVCVVVMMAVLVTDACQCRSQSIATHVAESDHVPVVHVVGPVQVVPETGTGGPLELRLVPSSSTSLSSPKNDKDESPPLHIPIRPLTSHRQDPQTSSSTLRNVAQDRLYLVQVRQTFQAPCPSNSTTMTPENQVQLLVTPTSTAACGVRLQTGQDYLVGVSSQQQDQVHPPSLDSVPTIITMPNNQNNEGIQPYQNTVVAKAMVWNRSASCLLPVVWSDVSLSELAVWQSLPPCSDDDDNNNQDHDS